MTRSTPPLLSDHHLLFSEALERLGRYLHGSLWSGREQFANLQTDFRGMKRDRLALMEELDSVERDVAKANDRIAHSLNDGEVSAAVGARDALFGRRSELHGQLGSLPELERLDECIDEVERYRATEDRLLSALRSGQIQAHGGRGNDLSIGVQPGHWKPGSGFRFDPLLSLAIFPKDYLSNRRALIWINRAAFDKWCDTQPVIHDDGTQQVAPRAQAEAWFKEEVRKAGSKRLKKRQMETEMIQKFGISGVQANEIWKARTPDSWRKGGRRPGS